MYEFTTSCCFIYYHKMFCHYLRLTYFLVHKVCIFPESQVYYFPDVLYGISYTYNILTIENLYRVMS